MSLLRFGKYEGLGNDFIVVGAESEQAVTPDQARQLCDRHFGIGADGVILILPSDAGARARMVVLNADGTRPEMCGNGLRCVALQLVLRDPSASRTLDVQTDAGIKTCQVALAEGAEPLSGEVSVDMGRGELLGDLGVNHEGRKHIFQRVSMGNPHAILFDAGYDEAEIDRFAPAVSSVIDGGSNVEFVTAMGERALGLVVWERGVGRTLACGTGAAATAVAAATSQRIPFGEPVSITLPGGPLSVTVARETLQVQMRGPAARVFTGEVTAP